MTNAEKYSKQIANLIADDPGAGTCIQFGAYLDLGDGFICSTCSLNKICNDPKEIEKWLRDEACNE